MIQSSSMARVEIYRLKKGGFQEVVATCHLEDTGLVVCEGDSRFVQRLIKFGILDRTVKPAVKVLPTGGRRFLEALKNNFKSGYLVSSSSNFSSD